MIPYKDRNLFSCEKYCNKQCIITVFSFINLLVTVLTTYNQLCDNLSLQFRGVERSLPDGVFEVDSGMNLKLIYRINIAYSKH